jgi:hypothetical protein
MCTVSFVGDSFEKHWTPRLPEWFPNGIPNTAPFPKRGGVPSYELPQISREEFDELKREVGLLKELLERALEYDKATGQPDCEQEQKIALLRAVAKAVGVELPI